MFNINNITIAGFLGADPETRFAQSGTAVGKLRLGISQRSSQNAQAPTMWLTVKCFGKQAEYAGENLRKGDAVCVTGKLVEEHWEKQDKTPMKAFVVNADLVYKDRLPNDHAQTQAQPQAAAPAPQAPRRAPASANGAPRVPTAPPAAPPDDTTDIDSVPF